jgi:hypothetical protein
MGSDMTDFLLRRAGKSADNEQIFMLAKQAAAKRTSDGTPLNRAVVDTVRDQNLTDDQVRRVVELANSNAFLDEFESKPDDPIEFDLADSDQVLDNVHGTPEQKEETKEASAKFLFFKRRHHSDPKSWPEHRPIEKTADVSSPYTIIQVYDKLAEAMCELRKEAHLAERRIRSVTDDIVKEASGMLHDGETVGDVSYPMVSILGVDTAGIMMDKVASRMGHSDYDVSLDAFDTRRVLNPDHPLVDSCRELSQATKKLAEAHGAKRIISLDMEQLETARKRELQAGK